jgi:hypothetical protein
MLGKCYSSLRVSSQKPWGMKPKSAPSARQSPSRSTCSGRASSRPLRLSVHTGGCALLSIIGVSHAGLWERFGPEETRLAGRLNVFVGFRASEASLPSCDALCSGRRSSSSVLRRLGLSLRREWEVDGRGTARFRFVVPWRDFGTSSGGGVRGGRIETPKASHELTRLWELLSKFIVVVVCLLQLRYG